MNMTNSKEVSFIHSVLYREVPLYIQCIGIKTHPSPTAPQRRNLNIISAIHMLPGFQLDDHVMAIYQDAMATFKLIS